EIAVGPRVGSLLWCGALLAVDGRGFGIPPVGPAGVIVPRLEAEARQEQPGTSVARSGGSSGDGRPVAHLDGFSRFPALPALGAWPPTAPSSRTCPLECHASENRDHSGHPRGRDRRDGLGVWRAGVAFGSDRVNKHIFGV